MELSGIRDKSLIASCKSPFANGWEGEELSGEERGGGAAARSGDGGCEGRCCSGS